ncbi:MAG: TolC family protein [Bryobacteraceae bacterium]
MRKHFLAVLFPLAALAADVQAPPRVGVGVIERKLPLKDAIEMALKNNLEVEIERTNISSAQQSLNAAKGTFDGFFRWLPGYEHRNTPTASILLGAGGKLAESFHNENFAYQQRLNWNGASFQAGFDNSRQTTTNPFSGLNPATQSRLAFTFTQPLWRNRLIDRERAEIQIRSKQINVSQADLEVRVMDVVTRVVTAYWDLVAARQDVDVKADGVRWAEEQLGRTARMIDSGSLAPIEKSAAEAELQRRMDTYYASVGFVTEAENALKTLIAGNRQDELWNDVLIPVDQDDAPSRAPDDVKAAVTEAVSKRPELKSLTLRKDSNDVQKAQALDQLKPQINLVGTYANTGLAGSVSSAENPFTASSLAQAVRINELSTRAGLPPLPSNSLGGAPGGLIGGYATTLSNLFGGNYQTAIVGLQMDWNPRNRTAQANVQQTVISERRLQLDRSRIEQAISAQVRNSLQAIQTAKQRIVAAEASAKAAKDKLDSETRLFQNGESTNFFVLTRQNEYTDSLRRVLVSRLDLNKAVARLWQAMGTTLEVHNVTVK